MPSTASSSVFQQLQQVQKLAEKQAEMLRAQEEAREKLARVQEATESALESVGFYPTPSTTTPSVLQVYASESLVRKASPLFEVRISSPYILRIGSRIHTYTPFGTLNDLIRHIVKEFGQYRTSGIVQTSSTRTFPVPAQTAPVCADDWKFVGKPQVAPRPATHWKPAPKPIVVKPAFDLCSESDFPSL